MEAETVSSGSGAHEVARSNSETISDLAVELRIQFRVPGSIRLQGEGDRELSGHGAMTGHQERGNARLLPRRHATRRIEGTEEHAHGDTSVRRNCAQMVVTLRERDERITRVLRGDPYRAVALPFPGENILGES